MKRLLAPLFAIALAGCGAKSDADHQADVVQGMHDQMLTQLQALHDAAAELQAAAPAPQGRGWDATQDAQAISQMKAAWQKARSAYELVEGAVAPLFPDNDYEIDARYDDFLADLAPDGDADLFDGEGVTGMHAVERILFADATPENVIEQESTLPGYTAAAWPADEAEAARFKDALVARLVTDTQALADQWTPQNIDVGGAFEGLTALMNEQREKVNKAASAEEESRYSQRTMKDIRDNLAGTRDAYALFQPWLLSKPDGEAIDAQIQAAFTALDTAYAKVDGDAIPRPPADWSSESPTEANLQTPFGQLFAAVNQAVDPNQAGSAVDGMNRAAEALGLPGFVE
jgi:iron uptake system component EfeO